MHQKFPPNAFLQKGFITKTLKRLAAAEGYLQLGMAQHALDELDAVEDSRSCEAPLQFLKGEALRCQKRYDEAVSSLQRAAMLFPAPFNQQAWLALAECFQATGRDALARAAAQAARSVAAPMPGTTAVQIVVRPIVVVKSAGRPRG